MERKEWCRAHLDALAILTYCSCRSAGRAAKRQEYLLSLNPQVAYLYALKVLRGRFRDGEAAMSLEPQWAVRYARFVLKSRFPRAERRISSDPRWACEYAMKVVKGRLPPRMHRRLASMVSNPFAQKYMRFQLAKSPDQG